MKQQRNTQLIHGGRHIPAHSSGAGYPVNPSVMRASTILFDDLACWRDTRKRRSTERLLSYGARGTDTAFALEKLVTEMESGYRCQLFPTGLAAIAFTILGFVHSGEHVLFADSVYEPVRNISRYFLQANNIQYSFFRADGGDVIQHILPQTRLIFAESPGSLLYELVDLPEICRIAHERNIPVAVDNTWGSAYLCNPLQLGADVSVIAATKYLSGHSDVMMGMLVANEQAWQKAGTLPEALGQCASPDDCALVLRGMRTLAVRLAAHGNGALQVARWLQQRTELEKVWFPALEDHPQHALWHRDCHGVNGLLTMEFKPGYARQLTDAFIDRLTLFGIGASWGGFESLVLPANVHGARTVTDWRNHGAFIRLHIGLEDPEDLIADLQQAFQVFH